MEPPASSQCYCQIAIIFESVLSIEFPPVLFQIILFGGELGCSLILWTASLLWAKSLELASFRLTPYLRSRLLGDEPLHSEFGLGGGRVSYLSDMLTRNLASATWKFSLFPISCHPALGLEGARALVLPCILPG